MTTNTFALDLQQPFNLRMTVESHGWCQLAPWHWNDERLERTVRVGENAEWARVHQPSEDQLVIETSSSSPDAVSERVARWLQLDWDPSEFLALCERNDPEIARFIRSGGGRFLRGDTFFEDLIKTICTINTTWKQTKSMVASLVALGDGVFPEPHELQTIGPERLAKECKLGFRARTVDTVTDQLLRDQAIQTDGTACDDIINYDYLISLKGIGPYAAAHTMMLMRNFETLPVDSEVSAYLRQQGLDPKYAQNAFQHWDKYRFLGYKLKRIVDKSNWIGD
jgi:3-methyladenine DNA glycosylase/8-oxoguanine DNA glycosylase